MYENVRFCDDYIKKIGHFLYCGDNRSMVVSIMTTDKTAEYTKE